MDVICDDRDELIVKNEEIGCCMYYIGWKIVLGRREYEGNRHKGPRVNVKPQKYYENEN